MPVAIDDFALLASDVGFPVTPVPAESQYFGVVVRELSDGQQVWVVRMLVNWRVMETYWPSVGHGRYWCYAGTNPLTYLRAVGHAATYGDGEPDGWVRSGDGGTHGQT